MTMTESDWTGLYGESWRDLIVPDAFAHPAKFARGLIRRIYAHAAEEGWLAVGTTVVDPFGGVALGGFEAAWRGAHWIGCELEPRFVALGERNIALWAERFGHLPTWGSARLVQGDSRNLGAVLSGVGLCVASPPYAEALSNPATNVELTGKGGPIHPRNYGDNSSNLGNLKADEAGFRLAVGSPPFAETLNNAPMQLPHDTTGNFRNNYGDIAGQLGAMRGTGFDVVVSSPPFEASVNREGEWHKSLDPHKNSRPQNRSDAYLERNRATESYGTANGQLGREQGDNFWTAARTILEQTYAVLAPGGHAIFVLKGFVRKGRYVDFPDQWRQLSESVGFTTLHWHRCWLTEAGNVQANLLGEAEKDHSVERKSFFRRLAESKGSPRIDYEVTLCQVKESR